MKLHRLAWLLLPLFLTAASPPFTLDIANPTDTALVSSYPANERAFRDNANSYINTAWRCAKRRCARLRIFR